MGKSGIEWTSSHPLNLIDTLLDLADVADTEVYEVAEENKEKVVRVAKQKAPVDTGRLRDSIYGRVKKNGNDVVILIGSDVHYAVYVEMGTSKMRAQPYIRPAFEEVAPEYREDLAQSIADMA